MKLFDNDLDVDSKMSRLIEECDDVEYPEYIIMSTTTFTLFSELSKCVDKKKMTWEYEFDIYSIAIDKGLMFGTVVIK